MKRKSKIKLGELVAEKAIMGVAFLSIAFIALIFIFVFREAVPLVLGKALDEFGTVSLKNLFNSISWMPVSNHPAYGIFPLFYSSMKITIISIIIATPLSIASALYTSLFAPKWLKEIIKPAIEILAGFPSVVIGFFALIVLATYIQNIFGIQYRLNAFVGGVALSLAVIPIIFTITEDSLNAVPKTIIDASYALGAQKWETGLFVMLPVASPGIIAAVLLGFGRAFGETMIVLMATGNAPFMNLSIFEPVRTMSATIGAEMAEVVFGDAHYNILFFIGIVLFVVSFSLNAVTEFYVKQKLLKKLKGA
jgi:phosphate transport system permease protein